MPWFSWRRALPGMALCVRWANCCVTCKGPCSGRRRGVLEAAVRAFEMTRSSGKNAKVPSFKKQRLHTHSSPWGRLAADSECAPCLIFVASGHLIFHTKPTEHKRKAYMSENSRCLPLAAKLTEDLMLSIERKGPPTAVACCPCFTDFRGEI